MQTSRASQARGHLFLLMLAVAGVLLHGYHLGVDDQATYLPAIKHDLDAALYPFDAQFFLAQTQWMLFDKVIAFSIQFARLPLDWAIFIWYMLSIYLRLLASWKISRQVFTTAEAHWASVLTVWALLPLQVAGTGVQLMDNYLHPRGFAGTAILFGLAAALQRKPAALLWIALAGILHPTMGLFGAVYLAVQVWPVPQTAMSALVPVWIPTASESAWYEVLYSRRFILPLEWTWYEWLGAYGPLGLLLGIVWLARRTNRVVLANVSGRLAAYGGLGIAAALMINTVPGFERWVPTEPMRILYYVYAVFFLLAGGLMGQYLLGNRIWRWLIVFVPLSSVMVWAQRRDYPASPNVEWPGRVPRNAWVEAFDWVRRYTPRDALIALDPRHMERPGEDFHGFRAWAERSMLADYVKDRAVASNFPELAPIWREQVRAREAWRSYRAQDFLRLQAAYGVNWIVVERPANGLRPRSVEGLECPFRNDLLFVCHLDADRYAREQSEPDRKAVQTSHRLATTTGDDAEY